MLHLRVDIHQSLDKSCEALLQQLHSTLTPEDASNLVSIDSQDPGYQLATDEEIIKQVSQTTFSDSSDEEEEPIKCVSNGQAADMLEECLKWYEHQQEATPTSLMVLKGVRDLAYRKRYSNFNRRHLNIFYPSI